MHLARLQASFERAKDAGDNFALLFYTRLFDAHPELREMFPLSMTEMRKHLMTALGFIVAGAGNPDRIAGYLQKLGIGHRGFNVLHDGGHYEAVGECLLATLRYFCAEEWTPELEKDWTDAYTLISKVMRDAARQDEKTGPAVWAATVVSCERRAHDISVLHVKPEARLDYLPGQAVPVEIGSRPRERRRYAPASPPRADGLLEFHVRAAGAVGLPLAMAEPGTRLRLRRAVGEMTLRDTGPALMVAVSAGLAPMLAMLGQLAALPSPPPVSLYWAAPDTEGLYLWPEIEKMATQWRQWLRVTPVPGGGSRSLAEAVATGGPWGSCSAYASGPPKYVADVTAVLARDGMMQNQIRTDDSGMEDWNEP